jgi:hypothetical protein
MNNLYFIGKKLPKSWGEKKLWNDLGGFQLLKVRKKKTIVKLIYFIFNVEP